MATEAQMEKRRSKQVEEILTAVNELRTEVTDLKADIGRTDEVELKAEFDETIDRTDEILAAIRSMADEIVNLKAEVAELQAAITPPPTSRRTKK